MPISPTLLRFHAEPSAVDLVACEAVCLKQGEESASVWVKLVNAECVIENVGSCGCERESKRMTVGWVWLMTGYGDVIYKYTNIDASVHKTLMFIMVYTAHTKAVLWRVSFGCQFQAGKIPTLTNTIIYLFLL